MRTNRTLGARIWNWFRGVADLQRLQAIPPVDLGLAAADVAAAARIGAGVPDRMRRMAAVFGADAALGAVDRYHYLDMARLCDGCASRRVCAHVLDAPGMKTADEVSFCPNGGAYRALAVAAGGS